MDRPLDIAFHNTDSSPAAEADIRCHVDKLATRYPHLIACRVSVEALHNQHGTGNVFDVHIVLSVPGPGSGRVAGAAPCQGPLCPPRHPNLAA